MRLLRIESPLMRGEDVREFQRAANEIVGAGLMVDGIYGQNSETAAKALQTHFGLTDDGIVGPKTWAAIEAYNQPDTNLQEEIKRLQEDNQKLINKVKALEAEVNSKSALLMEASNKLKNARSAIDTLKLL